MPEIENNQILVIGSGEAGKYLAWTMAKAGHRTAVVERKFICGALYGTRSPVQAFSEMFWWLPL